MGSHHNFGQVTCDQATALLLVRSDEAHLLFEYLSLTEEQDAMRYLTLLLNYIQYNINELVVIYLFQLKENN